MLNLPVTKRQDLMIRSYAIILMIFLIAVMPVRHINAQADIEPKISSPEAGSALQGIVTITGSDNLAGRLYSEISFAYIGDTTATWFFIARIGESVEEGTLANWDTTRITDGNYVLRLRVYLGNDSYRDAGITNLRVRNYTPIETPTPAPTAIKPTLVPTITATPAPFPTPTFLPPNQAIITSGDVFQSVAFGGIGAVILLFILGFYLWLRRK
jgi:hypothetical protein